MPRYEHDRANCGTFPNFHSLAEYQMPGEIFRPKGPGPAVDTAVALILKFPAASGRKSCFEKPKTPILGSKGGHRHYVRGPPRREVRLRRIWNNERISSAEARNVSQPLDLYLVGFGMHAR
jgi:hypothetical protein